MKKRFLSFVFAICFIIPCMFVLAGCGQGKGIKLEGKSIVFDSFEDLVWEQEALYVYKWYGDAKYEANLTLEEFVKNYWDSEAFARGVGSASGFNSLEEAKGTLRQKMFNSYKSNFYNYKFSEDGATVTRYAYSDIDFSSPISTYNVTIRNTEFGYTYEMDIPEGNGLSFIFSEPNYIRWSGVLEGKSLFFKGFEDEEITLKSPNGTKKDVKLADFNDNTDGGFQVTISVNANNLYKIAN